MLIRTHLIIALFFSLIFLNYFDNKLLFLIIVLISTFIPDIDSRFSKLGKIIIFRPLQFFAGHRKIFHSFLFLGLISFPLFFISKTIFYGFILGYGLHLFVDCFSVMGIKPFYPFEYKVRGFIRTGGFFETIWFYIFLFISFWLIIRYFLIV
ncbi:MAG: metal-dependent hydrolase [Nanoarchaeota archaeon]